MNTIGIACSPRPKGNSTILMERALQIYADRGEQVEAVYLRKLDFSPCIGCGSCSNTGHCIFKDDLPALFAKIEAADRILIAAPIFSMSINALGKAMIDRTQVYWARKYILKEPEREHKSLGMFISTAGMDLPGIHDCSKRIIRYFFKMMDIRYDQDFLVTKVDAPGEILEQPHQLEALDKQLMSE